MWREQFARNDTRGLHTVSDADVSWQGYIGRAVSGRKLDLFAFAGFCRRSWRALTAPRCGRALCNTLCNTTPLRFRSRLWSAAR